MAITKETIQDKIEVVGDFKHIQVRTATVIKEDGVELSRSFHRHVVSPDSDSTNESADVKAMVKQFHTDAVKKAYKTHIESSTPINGTAIDLDGKEMILDADQDTTITVDTDDQIDIKIAGTDQITIKDGAVSPVTNNDVDLGTSSLGYKDIYLTSQLKFNNFEIGDQSIDGNTVIFRLANETETMRIDSSGRLLLGTSTPSSYSNRMFTVAGNDDATIEIRANPSNGHSQLVFSDGTAADNSSQRGYIIYDHPDENFKFGVYDTEFMRAHSIGAVTFSKQPAFLVQPSSQQDNIPINGSTTVVFDTERFDQNGDFSSNTFTAPVTGRYQLNVQLMIQQMDKDTDYIGVELRTSNRVYTVYHDNDGMAADMPNGEEKNIIVLADMDENDTAFVVLSLPNSGAAQMDVTTLSAFSGFLAC
jgi:hypothetical protein